MQPELFGHVVGICNLNHHRQGHIGYNLYIRKHTHIYTYIFLKVLSAWFLCNGSCPLQSARWAWGRGNPRQEEGEGGEGEAGEAGETLGPWRFRRAKAFAALAPRSLLPPTPNTRFFQDTCWKTWFSMVNTSLFSRGSTSYPEKSWCWEKGCRFFVVFH